MWIEVDCEAMHFDCFFSREEEEEDNDGKDDVERLALAILDAEDRIMVWQFNLIMEIVGRPW